MELLTASRARCFRACARRHLYEYEQGYRPVTAAHAMRFGTAIHSALEAWWISQGPAATGGHPLAEALAALPRDMDPVDRARAEVMIAGYDARWAGDLHCGLAVEAEFTLPLRDPTTGRAHPKWLLAGKIDALARLADGRVAIVEHKTSSEAVDVGAGSDYRTRLTLDGQLSQYYDGAAALGYRADVALYDVLVKPAQRPLLATENPRWTQGKPATKTKPAEAPRLCAGQRTEDEGLEAFQARVAAAVAADPDRFYQRSEVVRLGTEREAHEFDVWALAAMIDHARLMELAPRNPEACFKYGARCPFWEVCTGAADIDDPTLYRRATTAHEELSATAARAA